MKQIFESVDKYVDLDALQYQSQESVFKNRFVESRNNSIQIIPICIHTYTNKNED